MKWKLLLLLTVPMLVVLQVSFVSTLMGVWLTPNLVFALAISFAMIERDDLAYLCAFVGGLFIDLLGFSTVGVSSLVSTSLVLAFIVARKYLFRGKIFSVLLVYFLGIVNFVLPYFPSVQFSPNVFTCSLSTTVMCAIFYLLFIRFTNVEEKSY